VKIVKILTIITVVVLVSSLIWTVFEKKAKEKVKLETEIDKISYIMGIQAGNQLKTMLLKINPDALAMGIKDVLTDDKLEMTDGEMADVSMKFQQKMMAQQEAQNPEVQKNLAYANAFLEENSKKSGVKVLPSGLQYKVIKNGTGKNPSATSKVKVHYRGTLINGKEFDSSYKRNAQAEITLNQVIPGWTEGLQLMKVGGKYQFFIPPNLGYGARGAGADIPPNSALIFEVELLEILE
jgi:FKBP-type peptidyl-prolyl cis-trans isomerase FklB